MYNGINTVNHQHSCNYPNMMCWNLSLSHQGATYENSISNTLSVFNNRKHTFGEKNNIPTWFLKHWKNILTKIYGIKNSEKQHIKSISQLEKVVFNSALDISKLK